VQQLRAQITELRSQLQTKRVEFDGAQGELETQRRLEREAAVLRERLAGAEAESSARRAGIEGLTQQAVPAGPKINLVQVQVLEPEITAHS
jgi:multidrug resistance efflux pump